MPTEENDAQPAPDGSNLRKLSDLESEITAQFAILDSAIKLINQHHQKQKNGDSSYNAYGGWAYNMKDLADWVKYYTDRRRLHCLKCNADTTVKCEICGEVYEFHDEL